MVTDKGFRSTLPKGSREYTELVLKEAREDDVVGLDLLINSLERINKRRKNDKHSK